MTNKHTKFKSNFNQATVLVVEDSNDQWVFIQKAMEECLPEVSSVRTATPEQTLLQLQEWYREQFEVPKLILLDLYLPDRTDGWELLTQIKDMGAPFNQIPIVMLSSSSSSADITAAYQLGISSYLVKPVDFSGWLSCFAKIRSYWWETVTLPMASRSLL
jgi:CheY-like chemotaxis protein